MYVILTNKPGQYNSRIESGATVKEVYQYLFYGRLKAVYQLAELTKESRVVITEEVEPFISNSVPTKFLDKYPTLQAAREELEHLVGFGHLDAVLRPHGAAASLEA